MGQNQWDPVLGWVHDPFWSILVEIGMFSGGTGFGPMAICLPRIRIPSGIQEPQTRNLGLKPRSKIVWWLLLAFRASTADPNRCNEGICSRPSAAMEAKKQLNVLVYFVGTRGDVMPGVAVCQALEARGHKAAMAVCAGVEESIRAYGVRCITVSQVPFKWRDDTAHMSEEEVQIIRRSMDSNEFLKVESRRGMSWNLDECLPATLQGICNLMEKEHFDVILGTAITGLACVRLLKKCPHLKIIRSTFSFGFSSPPTSAYPPGGYEMSNGFVNKLKHYHFLFFKLLPLLAGASYFKRELSRMLEIEGIDHSQGLGPFSTLAKLPELGFWSESLQARPPDFPEQFLVTGCLFVPHLKDWTPLPALERFMQLRDSQGRKPVVLSFGSMLGVQRVELAVLEAAQRMGLNVVWCHESAGKERVAYSFTANSKDAEAPVQDGVCEVGVGKIKPGIGLQTAGFSPCFH